MISVKKILSLLCLAITFNNASASSETFADQERRELNMITPLCTHIKSDTSGLRHTVAECLRGNKQLAARICNWIKELDAVMEDYNNRFDEIMRHTSSIRTIIHDREAADSISLNILQRERRANMDSTRDISDKLAKTEAALAELIEERKESEKALQSILCGNPSESSMFMQIQEKVRSRQSSPYEMFLYGILLNLVGENR